MGSDYPYEAKRRVEALIETLEPLVAKDSEQEIRGIAVPVFEATLDVLKEALPDDPVVQKVIGAYELEFETGEPVRAVDALLVARQVTPASGRIRSLSLDMVTAFADQPRGKEHAASRRLRRHSCRIMPVLALPNQVAGQGSKWSSPSAVLADP
ncbi:MAG: hypothetical protein GY713_12870 [Actinomycetia bacterium]|nr:hypothetical protein [Actinomycetes bacterium]